MIEEMKPIENGDYWTFVKENKLNFQDKLTDEYLIFLNDETHKMKY
jgi:hypothetical protein